MVYLDHIYIDIWHQDYGIVMCFLKYHNFSFIMSHIFSNVDTGYNLEEFNNTDANANIAPQRVWALRQNRIFIISTWSISSFICPLSNWGSLHPSFLYWIFHPYPLFHRHILARFSALSLYCSSFCLEL